MQQAMLEKAVSRIASELHKNHGYGRAGALDRACNISQAALNSASTGDRLTIDAVFELLTPTDVLRGIPSMIERELASRQIARLWIAETTVLPVCAWAKLIENTAMTPADASEWMRAEGYIEPMRGIACSL